MATHLILIPFSSIFLPDLYHPLFVDAEGIIREIEKVDAFF